MLSAHVADREELTAASARNKSASSVFVFLLKTDILPAEAVHHIKIKLLNLV